MGDKLIEGKTLLLRDAVYIITLMISCTVTYMTTSYTARSALSLAQENKAYGIAREKQIFNLERNLKDYTREHSHKGDAEIMVDVKKNTESIHTAKEAMIEARVERSHLEKNQEKMLEILETLQKQ